MKTIEFELWINNRLRLNKNSLVIEQKIWDDINFEDISIRFYKEFNVLRITCPVAEFIIICEIIIATKSMCSIHFSSSNMTNIVTVTSYSYGKRLFKSIQDMYNFIIYHKFHSLLPHEVLELRG